MFHYHQSNRPALTLSSFSICFVSFLCPTHAFPSSVCWQPCSIALSPRLKSWCMWLHTCFVLALWSRLLHGVLKGPIQRRSIMAVVASWAPFPLVTTHICLKRTVKLCGSFSTRAICLQKLTPLPPVACTDSGEMEILQHNPSRDTYGCQT